MLDDVKTHIIGCLGADSLSITELKPFITLGSGCDVLDCQFIADNTSFTSGVLKIYRKDFDNYSGIGTVRTAKKFQLACLELNTGDIYLPEVMGCYVFDEEASVLTEKLVAIEWDAQTRIAAARLLSQLHSVSLSGLSSEFQELIRESQTNRDRIRNGVVGTGEYLDNKYPDWQVNYPQLFKYTMEIIDSVEPRSSLETLVHGDYFSKNILRTKDGVYIIDWDLLALGDPMWDLGFLVGAEPDIDENEVEAVIAEYRRCCPIDEDILSWHRKCWYTFQELIKFVKTLDSRFSLLDRLES